MFVSLDLETTGFDPIKNKIIEFGAIKFDLNGNTETLQFLANPGIPLPDIITHITGITDEDLKDSPPFEENLEKAKEFIQDLPIVGHNIQFDVNFLNSNNVDTDKNSLYDTCQLASILLPGLSSYSLEILTHHLNLTHEEKHRALDDAIAAMELFQKLAQQFQSLPKETIEEIHTLCKKTNWPLTNLLQSLNHDPNKTSIIPSSTTPPSSEISTTNTSKSNHQLPPALLKDESALHEILPPYNDLIKKLINKSKENTIISIPHQLFYKLKDELSNTPLIDTPHKYISEKRFETFKNKESFSDEEFIALLKIIIWIPTTKTGLLNELAFFREEKSIFKQICIDKNFHPLDKEPFFKNSLPPKYICTHEYLSEYLNVAKSNLSPTIKNLILIDIQKLSESLHFTNSRFTKQNLLHLELQLIQENSKKTETLEQLKSKTDILFGLIENYFEKYNDHDAFKKRAFLDNFYLSSKEAQNIKDTISNLIEISKDLSKILTNQNIGYLKLWKKSLETLDKTLRSPNPEKELIWLEEDFSEEIVVRSSPISLSEPLNNILSSSEYYKIIDENLDLNDECSNTKKTYQLPENLKFYKDYPMRKDLQIFIAEDLPLNEPGEQTLTKFIQDYCHEKKGKTVIIFNSRKKLEQFTLALGQPLKEIGLTLISQLTGSLGKLTEQFKKDPSNTILFMTPNFWNNFTEHPQINNLLIHKIPFDPPSDPFIISSGKNFEDPWNQFQIPKAIFSLKKLINHLTPSEIIPKTTSNTTSKTPTKEAIVLDSRISQKSYGAQFIDNLSSIATIKIVNIASLLA